MKKIILTGGGTAGHVTPNIALLPFLQADGYEVHYIGSKEGLERGLIEPYGIPYHCISAGKLRRYADVKNITDIFKILRGFGGAFGIIRRLKPDILFSKGGFVSVPAVAAARMLGVKCVVHESDITPGLANRLSQPFASKICASFPETLTHLPEHKGVLTGTPIRQELLQGDNEKGIRFLEWRAEGKPIIMAMGGSQGSVMINNCVRAALPELLQRFRVIHLCGKGNLSGQKKPGYAEFEYMGSELADLYALADIVVSRAGANTLFELLAIRKPNLLIPLDAGSRGDQKANAESFALQGFSKILPEKALNPERLLKDVQLLYNERDNFIRNMSSHKQGDGAAEVMDVLRKLTPD